MKRTSSPFNLYYRQLKLIRSIDAHNCDSSGRIEFVDPQYGQAEIYWQDKKRLPSSYDLKRYKGLARTAFVLFNVDPESILTTYYQFNSFIDPGQITKRSFNHLPHEIKLFNSDYFNNELEERFGFNELDEQDHQRIGTILINLLDH